MPRKRTGKMKSTSKSEEEREEEGRPRRREEDALVLGATAFKMLSPTDPRQPSLEPNPSPRLASLIITEHAIPLHALRFVLSHLFDRASAAGVQRSPLYGLSQPPPCALEPVHGLSDPRPLSASLDHALATAVAARCGSCSCCSSYLTRFPSPNRNGMAAHPPTPKELSLDSNVSSAVQSCTFTLSSSLLTARR